MSKTTSIIDFISLQPYTRGYFCYVQNFTYKEVLEFFKKTAKETGDKSWLQCVKKCPEMFDTSCVAACRKRTLMYKNKETSFLFIIVHKGISPSNPEDMINLAHECLHLCQFYLPDFLDRDTEVEAEAYFHTYLMEKIVESINKT